MLAGLKEKHFIVYIIEESTGKLEQLQDQFDWSYYRSLKRHRQGREASLRRFIHDYSRTYNKRNDRADDTADGLSRYIAARLPKLPFAESSFDLVLCSHFLFLYGNTMDESFHLRAIDEMARVTKAGGEIRIYPLLRLDWKPYPRLEQLMDVVSKRHAAQVKLQESRLPFIPGSGHYLRIKIGNDPVKRL